MGRFQPMSTSRTFQMVGSPMPSTWTEATANAPKLAHAPPDAASMNAHLAAIINSSHDAILSLSRDRTILSWNAAAERMFGYTADEMIGQDILKIVPPEMAHEKQALFDSLIRDGSVQIETKRLHKDGHLIDVDLRLAPVLDSDGMIFAVSATLRDITQRKKAADARARAQEIIAEQAAQLDAVFNALTFPIVCFDRDGRPSRTNEAAKRILGSGQTPCSEVTHTEMAQRLRIESRDGPVDPDQLPSRRALRGETVEGEELRVVDSEGVSRIYACTGIPLRNGQEIVGAVSVWRDITEIHRRDLHNQILLREIAHRSKNLLSITQTIASRSAHNARSKEEFLDSFSQRLLALRNAQDLLARSPDAHTAMADIAISQLAHFLEADNPRIKIQGDEIRLRPEAAQTIGMALHELSTNAAKYGALSMPDGRVDIQWTIQRQKGDDAMFELVWCETGGPNVQEPKSCGFGRTFIEKIAAQSLSGASRLDFDPAGVIWVMSAPMSVVTDAPDLNAPRPKYPLAAS